jgi:hypothetical protein
MRDRLLVFTLLLTVAGASHACTCMRPGKDVATEWNEQWNASPVVVLTEIVGESSEPATSWLSRAHVLGRASPLHRRPLLHAVIHHRWKGNLAVGATVVIEKVDGAMCGYERWWQSRYHLLHLNKRERWVAGLCGLSRPVPDVERGVGEQDAEIARLKRSGHKPS